MCGTLLPCNWRNGRISPGERLRGERQGKDTTVWLLGLGLGSITREMKIQQAQTCLHEVLVKRDGWNSTYPLKWDFRRQDNCSQGTDDRVGATAMEQTELPFSIGMGLRADLIPWGLGILGATGGGALSKDIGVLRAATSWVLRARWFMGDSCREVRSRAGEGSQPICWAEVTAADPPQAQRAHTPKLSKELPSDRRLWASTWICSLFSVPSQALGRCSVNNCCGIHSGCF